ncbi:NUDIX hydrolase [Kitasatospora cineracea]|uniref:NUDIX hydrolase n=1 Tax=Kitasatospora cineracea TaxID=88074 RepID=UPI0037B96020
MDAPGNGGPDGVPVSVPVPVRVCAVLTDPNGRACVIRRRRPGKAQDSLPGGLSTSGEQPVVALRRELREELGLDRPPRTSTWCCGSSSTRRPCVRERAGLFRRRHLLYAAHLPRLPAEAVALVELDAEDDSEVLWLAPADLAGAHLYPDVAGHLSAAVTTPAPAPGAAPVLLSAMTDVIWRWR